jgi:molybdate transport system substrate-binding protein
MAIHRVAAAVAALLLPLAAAQAQAAEIKVLSSTALKAVLEELCPQFEKATENKVVLTLAPSAVIKTQIDQGAAFDVDILTVTLNDNLASTGKIVSAPRVTVARAGMGVAVRKGTAKPDISTTEALKRALLNAKSIGFNGQGASRSTFEALFTKLGIADALKAKITLLTTGAPEGVAKGVVEIGLGPISETLAEPGADLVGPLPADIQSYLVFTAGVSAGSKDPQAANTLIKFLAAPAAAPVLKAKGMEPG